MNPVELREDFNDAEYRHAYGESFLDSRLATQIYILRTQRGWSQSELASRAGMKQSAISRLEDPDYSAWTLSTLKRLSRAFDVRLSVGFESFGSIIEATRTMTRSHLEVPSFEHDPLMREQPSSVNEGPSVKAEASSEAATALDASGKILNVITSTILTSAVSASTAGVSPRRDSSSRTLFSPPNERITFVEAA